MQDTQRGSKKPSGRDATRLERQQRPEGLPPAWHSQEAVLQAKARGQHPSAQDIHGGICVFQVPSVICGVLVF